MEKFQTTAKEWLHIQNKMVDECKDFLKRVLSENNGHIDCEPKDSTCGVCVSYDGGNHPEYASNCFSTVYAVNMDKNGEITLDIDDCSEYYLENITAEELYLLCDFIDSLINKKYK